MRREEGELTSTDMKFKWLCSIFLLCLLTCTSSLTVSAGSSTSFAKPRAPPEVFRGKSELKYSPYKNYTIFGPENITIFTHESKHMLISSSFLFPTLSLLKTKTFPSHLSWRINKCPPAQQVVGRGETVGYHMFVCRSGVVMLRDLGRFRQPPVSLV